ncbi:MAG: Lipase/esterase [Modestobacter sp.]|nr:Lipase/esterase [Modestobacter sp.]
MTLSAAATAAGGRVGVAALPGDHRVVIEPAAEAWQLTVDWLQGRRTAAPDRTTLGS